jgi:hypothetical protein
MTTPVRSGAIAVIRNGLIGARGGVGLRGRRP